MPPRPSWSGHLRLSLVSLPVRLYNATASAERITFNMLHKDCHRRLRQQLVCPEHGTVDRNDVVKGYNYSGDKYVVVRDADLSKLKLEKSKEIEVVQFVDPTELDPMYFNTPYYLRPEGTVGLDAFRVVHEAIRKLKKIGMGRLVMAGREHACALRPFDRGFLLVTLLQADEIRRPDEIFDGIPDGSVNKSQLKLAEQLVHNLEAPLDLTQFKDRYREAVRELIEARIEGTEPVEVSEPEEVPQIINLMDALKRSVSEATRKKPPARSIRRVPEKKRKSKRA